MGNVEHEQLVAELSVDIISRQKRCFLAIDDSGILRFQGGNLAHYGLSGLGVGTPVLDRLKFLHGLVPLEGVGYLDLPATTIGDFGRCELHLSRRDNLTWVILLDPAGSTRESAHAVRISNDDTNYNVLDKYLGREIAERRSKGFASINQHGERREVSVLFADLRGFTAFCDSNSTVDIFPILNQFLGAMIKPVVDNKGMVDKIVGDSVMAVFGLIADEGPDYKARAFETGREMIERVADIIRDRGAAESVLGLGVGIASGDVVVGTLGNERRRSFTVIGHRVNLAARLEGQARPGEMLVDVATWDGLPKGRGQFDLTDLWLKGLTRPVPALSFFPCAEDSPDQDPPASG